LVGSNLGGVEWICGSAKVCSKMSCIRSEGSFPGLGRREADVPASPEAPSSSARKGMGVGDRDVGGRMVCKRRYGADQPRNLS